MIAAIAAIAASALRVRAERRVGQLLVAQPKAPGAKGRGPIAVAAVDRNDPPTLAEQGLTKDESSTYQRLAAVPDEEAPW